MGLKPAARVGDDIAHSNAGLGMGLGILAGVVVGAVIVGATVATGGAALAVVAAVGGAAAMTSAGGLSGMYIGEGSMGAPCGKFVTGSPNVFVNGRPATFTFGSMATCTKDGGAPLPLATGSSTVAINFGLAGRLDEKIACSAKSVVQVSPNVFIGGESAQDPRVAITPEVPDWAVTGLQVLGIAGAIVALPYAIATVGLAATVGGGVLGFGGGILGGKGGRALGEALGLSEGATRALETAGGLLGGMIGGAAGTRGTQAFNRNYQIKVDPNSLGMNGGNVRIVPRNPRSPFVTRFDPAHPGRPDPNWSVDTRRFDPNAASASRTAGGSIRDSKQFWSEWQNRHPETLSRSNQYRINELGLSPKVDKTWLNHFPEHRSYPRQVIEHHHYNQGDIAIPLPWQAHRGAGNYNIWHGDGP